MYSFVSFSPKQCDRALTKTLVEGSTSLHILGAAYNHWALNDGSINKNPKQFQAFAWGSNVPRLEKIKAELDPAHVFNARNTFGYLPVCDQPEDPPPCIPCPSDSQGRERKLLFTSLPSLPCC